MKDKLNVVESAAIGTVQGIVMAPVAIVVVWLIFSVMKAIGIF
jgi:hypothetical protein